MRAAMAPHVVRYYARLGLLRPTRDPRNQYQHFSEAELQRLAFSGKAKRPGFALGEVRLVLGDESQGQDAVSPGTRSRAAVG